MLLERQILSIFWDYNMHDHLAILVRTGGNFVKLIKKSAYQSNSSIFHYLQAPEEVSDLIAESIFSNPC